jgi:hypothetical protein
MLIWQGGYGGNASCRLPETFTNIDVRTMGSNSWQRMCFRIACDDSGLTHSCQEYCQYSILAAFRKTKGAWVLPNGTGMWGADTHNSSTYTTPEVTPLTAYDTVVAMFYQDAAAVVSIPPSGWTHVAKKTDIDMYYIAPGSTDPISATIKYTGSAYGVSGILILSEYPTPTNEILAGYNKRVKVVIDSTKVRNDLYNFPLLISLTSESGTGDTDCTDIFDTIGSDYTKIAVTTADGLTQIPVEVDRWDSSNKYARLWAKLPHVSCTEDAEVYVYYDEEASANNTYVGLPGSTAGASVWEDEYKHVWHLSNDPSGGTGSIKDSCGLQDGNPQGSMVAGDLISGNIAGHQALDFDGVDDWIYFPAGSGLYNMNGARYFSHEMLVMPDDLSSTGIASPLHLETSTAPRAYIRIKGVDTYLGWYHYSSLTNWGVDAWTSLTVSEDNWHYVACQYSGFYNTGVGWFRNENAVDGTWERETDGISTFGRNIAYGIGIGGYSSNKYDCAIGEVRIASKIRPRGWFDATYYALFDTLNSYSMEDVSPPVPNIVLDGEMLVGDEWKIVKNGTKRTVAGTYMLRKGIWRAISSTVEE